MAVSTTDVLSVNWRTNPVRASDVLQKLHAMLSMVDDQGFFNVEAGITSRKDTCSMGEITIDNTNYPALIRLKNPSRRELPKFMVLLPIRHFYYGLLMMVGLLGQDVHSGRETYQPHR